jgi:hypothetical protein
MIPNDDTKLTRCKLLNMPLKQELEVQADFLDKTCAGDDKSTPEVEALLTAHAPAGSFMEEPAGRSQPLRRV